MNDVRPSAAVASMDTSAVGTAVLVHGLWGNPEDWRWVRELVRDAGAVVVAPDLPSHRAPRAGLLDDAEEVREIIRGAIPPVVVAGWSYGGMVISVAADGEPSVSRLVYVSAVPGLVRREGFTDWIDEDPDLIRHPNGTFVLNNDWWLNEEAGTTFPAEVRDHLRRHPRRPVSRMAMSDPQPAAAWQTIPTTLVVGRFDDGGPADLEEVAALVQETRVLECDHFAIFRAPGPVSRAILDGFPPSSS